MTDGLCRVNCFVRRAIPRYNSAMRPGFALPALVALTALAACTPPPLWHKPGIAPAQVHADLTACRVAALSQVPQRIRSYYKPADYIIRPVCTATGHCYMQRILLRPAQYERYDANAGLRDDLAQACMADKGYAQLRLPACQSPQEQKITVNTAAPMPPLSDQSCAVRLPSGDWRIVTPTAP